MTSRSTDLPTQWDRVQSDWLVGELTVNVTLDAQPLEISIDSGETFLEASFTGDPGTTRAWQVYVTSADVPVGLTYQVIAHVTDDSDPDHQVDALIECGSITFT